VPPVVVLVGAPGAGKSTVGAGVADVLGVGFRDTDSDVESVVGEPIADQFVNDGEAVFREREREAVVRALAEHDGVLSLGGGAVLDDSTRELLKGQRVCWLEVSASAAGSRVGLGAGRPLLLGSVRSQLVTLLRDRAPLYAEVADHVVDTSDRAPQDVVRDVVEWLATQDPA